MAVPQFDGATELLRIDLSSGDMKVFPADSVEAVDLAFGMFEHETLDWPTQPVAVLATPDGPLLLLGEIQCRPVFGKTFVHVQASYVQVEHDGRHLFGQPCRAKHGIGLHPYNNSREDVDFWYWLRLRVDDPEFYSIYTQPIRYID